MKQNNFTQKNRAFYDASLISSLAFCERYELSTSAIDVAYYNNHPYVKKIAGALYVNEKALIRRREFYKRVWNKAHENYYNITEYITDAQFYNFLGRVLDRSRESWMQFLHYGLFSVAFNDKSILSYGISAQLWEFFRASTFVIRRLSRYERLVEAGKMRRKKSGGLKDDKRLLL